MSYLKIIGFTLTGLTAVILFKRMKEEYAFFISLFAGIMLTVTAFSMLEPLFSYIKSLGNSPQTESFITLCIKASGVAILTTVAADICRDSGESSLGSRLELCGKALILSFALPLIKNIFDSCLSMLG